MDIYMLPYQGDSRASHVIPFKVVKKHTHHVLCEPMQYPSELGISRPFKMSAFPAELKKAQKMNPQQFIQWVEKRKVFVDTVFTAHKGDPRAKEALHKWDEIKAELRKSS